MEIERKFTIRKLPDNLEQYECKVIEQGYLCTAPVVRIRKSNENYILTYKSKFGIEPNKSGVHVNNEVEVPLDETSYEHLKTKIDYHLISKSRYIIPIEHGLQVELDIFHGHLEGLKFAEIEFSSLEEAEKFELLDWFEKDVSKDFRYKNNYLCEIDNLDVFAK